MYARGGLGETTVQSPNPRVAAVAARSSSTARSSTFDRAVLGQTHLWGKKHAYSWTWGHCAELHGRARRACSSCSACGSQRRGITLPPLMLVALDLDGEQHRLNQFRHVARQPRRRWQHRPRRRSRRGRATVKIEGELTVHARADGQRAVPRSRRHDACSARTPRSATRASRSASARASAGGSIAGSRRTAARTSRSAGASAIRRSTREHVLVA